MNSLHPRLPVDMPLDTALSLDSLDRALVRTAIWRSLCLVIGDLQGTVVDIGCGRGPYRSLLLAPPSRITNYIGLDLSGNHYDRRGSAASVYWDGRAMPFAANSVDGAIATEVFEHCPDPSAIMAEALRVLKPGGRLFFTVPFLWPLHDVPYDEYRYTPFSLERHLRSAGFGGIQIGALGGWDASLAQMLGLWVRRRPLPVPVRMLLSVLLFPAVWLLSKTDKTPAAFTESQMVTGLWGIAAKPERREDPK